MKPYSLETRILIIVALPILLMAVGFGWYLIELRSNELEKSYLNQLNQLTYSTARLLGKVDLDTEPQANRYAEALLGSDLVESVTLVDRSNKILTHQGKPLAIRLNPKSFPERQPQFFQIQDESIFIAPIIKSEESEVSGEASNSSKTSGWLLVKTSHNESAIQFSNTIKKTIWYLLLILTACFFAVSALSKYILKPINDIAIGLAKIVDGNVNLRINENSAVEMNHLVKGINTLAKRLSQTQTDMTLEIEQTNEDLRETLETIEVQNVELDIARKQAVLANRTKSEFLANMSHEIRTPLNGILGFTKLLLKSPLTNRQQEHLLTIKKSSEILLLIINDILDFSKIEAGKLLLAKKPVLIRELIEEVVTMLAPTAHAKNLELVHLHYQDVPDELIGDPLRIKQVITNLINNAIKFTHSGEVVVRVMLTEDTPGITREFIKISVDDTGVGLSRAQQHSIFNAFSQADATTARHFGGTGLGLTISKNLIEQMEGEISFQSELGKGSSFWFTLPIDLPEHKHEGKQLDQLIGKTILCLETRPSTRLAIEHLFSAWKLDYQFTDSNQQLITLAEKLYAEGKHNCISMFCLDRNDLNLPENSQIIQRLHTLNQKVLLITPTLEHYEPDIIEYAHAHLVKPLTRSRFYHALNELYSNSIETSPGQEAAALKQAEIKQLPFMQTSPNLCGEILVVDDNDINLSLVISILEDMGIAADSARDGFEAVELCKLNHYSLIFMDIQMPGMDGSETMAHIRLLNEHYKQTTIIALTAYALPEEKETFLQQGFQRLMTKPIDEAKLQSVVTDLLSEPRPNPKPVLTNADVLFSMPASAPANESPETESIDFAECLKLSNYNNESALVFLEKFLQSLDEEHTTIQQLSAEKKMAQLEAAVHKLHGACHYCGVPKLREAARHAEHSLKCLDQDIDTCISALLAELDTLIMWRDQQNGAWKQQFNSS